MLPSISAQELFRAIFLRSRIAPKRTVESSDPLRHPNPVPPKMRDDPGPISAPLGSRKKEEGESEALPPSLSSFSSILYLDRGRAPLSLIFRVPEGRYVSLLPLSLPPSPQETSVGRSVGRSMGQSVGRSVGLQLRQSFCREIS